MTDDHSLSAERKLREDLVQTVLPEITADSLRRSAKGEFVNDTADSLREKLADSAVKLADAVIERLAERGAPGMCCVTYAHSGHLFSCALPIGHDGPHWNQHMEPEQEPTP